MNSGSIEKEILDKYNNVCADALVESARKNVKLLEKLDFYDICISLKASNLDLCIEAYKKASKEFNYPLHIGITESGTSFGGTIKSSIGLGILLKDGIGDTIRVSLTDEPKQEVKVAKEILKCCNLLSGPKIISCPTCGRTEIDLIPLVKKVEKYIENINKNITIAIMGCAVNGPGEAKEADIGIAGGKNEGLLFKKGKIIKKIPQNKMFETLIEEIENYK